MLGAASQHIEIAQELLADTVHAPLRNDLDAGSDSSSATSADAYFTCFCVPAGKPCKDMAAGPDMVQLVGVQVTQRIQPDWQTVPELHVWNDHGRGV